MRYERRNQNACPIKNVGRNKGKRGHTMQNPQRTFRPFKSFGTLRKLVYVSSYSYTLYTLHAAHVALSFYDTNSIAR